MPSRRTSRNRPLVATVFGTRPQYIKLAMLWRSLEKSFRSVLIDSGQHYDWNMAGIFHEGTGLRLPDYHLGIKSVSAVSQIGRIADALDGRLARLKPDAAIVIGDTSTTAAGAIAAAYRGIPLAHIEAGLRSFDRAAPEEKNRVIADHLATWRFCPTRSAMKHLDAEGINDGVFGVGDLMYEHFRRARKSKPSSGLSSSEINTGEYFYVTAHRAENVDSRANLNLLIDVLLSLNSPVVYPIHPRARKNLVQFGLWKKLSNAAQIRLLPPASHAESLSWIGRAKMVLTDSGGVQRESYWSRVPCLIIRETTEWNELLSCGAGILTGLDPDRIARALRRNFVIRPVQDRVFSITRPSALIVRQLADGIASL